MECTNSAYIYKGFIDCHPFILLILFELPHILSFSYEKIRKAPFCTFFFFGVCVGGGGG